MKNNPKKQFFTNAISGIIAQVAMIGVGVIIMPYAIYRLGSESFGIFQLSRSSILFFALLQIGMGPTLIRFCSQSIVRKDFDKIRKIGSTALLMLGFLGIFGALIVMALIPVFMHFYNIVPSLKSDTSGLLICMALSLFLNMVILVPSGILQGANRYDIANGIDICTHLLRLIIAVALFELINPSVLFLGLSMLVAEIFRFISLLVCAIWKINVGNIFSPRYTDKKTALSLWGFSSLNLVNYIASFGYIQAPILIIGKTMGIDYVTLFAPVVLTSTLIESLLGQLSRPLVPMASQIQAESGTKKMGELTVEFASLVSICGLAMSLPFCVFGREIIELWLGTNMSEIWGVVAVITLGTSISQVVTVIYYLALGGGCIKPAVYAQAIFGFLASFGVYIGTQFADIGLFDVVIIILFFRCLRNVIYLPYAYAQQFGYSLLHYYVLAYIKPLFIFIITVGLGYMMIFFISPTNLIILGLEISIVIILYGSLAWRLIMPKTIKSQCMAAAFGFIEKIKIRNGEPNQ